MEKSHRLDGLDDPFFGELQDDDSIEKELQNKFNLANQRYGETRKITKGKAKRPKALDLGDGRGRSRRDAAQSKFLKILIFMIQLFYRCRVKPYDSQIT